MPRAAFKTVHQQSCSVSSSAGSCSCVNSWGEWKYPRLIEISENVSPECLFGRYNLRLEVFHAYYHGSLTQHSYPCQGRGQRKEKGSLGPIKGIVLSSSFPSLQNYFKTIKLLTYTPYTKWQYHGKVNNHDLHPCKNWHAYEQVLPYSPSCLDYINLGDRLRTITEHLLWKLL